MKDKLYALLRAVCVLVVGILLIAYREQWADALVIGVGAVFALFGLCSVVSWLIKRARSGTSPFFPVLGVAGVLLGVLLMTASETFLKVFIYIIGGLLVCLALYELFSLTALHREARLPGWLYLPPVVALLLGVYSLWNPTKAAALPFLLTGIGCAVCALGRILATVLWAFKRKRKD